MDDSAIICDEFVKSYDEEIKTFPRNFNKKNRTCKTQSLHVLLTFLLIAIILFITISICCYLIKYWPKQKYPLLLHDTILKQFCVGTINWKWVIKLKI